jgi:hypothetical protein
MISLEYLHQNAILHRDVKPENLVFDKTGYLRLTDLGIARYWKQENSQDTSGTPGYMAPEVMCSNHSLIITFKGKIMVLQLIITQWESSSMSAWSKISLNI